MDDHPGSEQEVERRLYAEGIRLFNEGQFFEAHDAWEEVWKLTRDKRREQFYRGIIQGAVTLELLRRGRAVGCRQVFVSCHDLLSVLPPVFMGLDLGRFIECLRHAIRPAIDDLNATHVQIDPARLFHIELAYDPFSDPGNGEFPGLDAK